MKTACILSIGDELTSGLTLNTNCAWLSAQLAALGIATVAQVTVGDDLPVIARAITELCVSADLLLVSGGLGPTADDLTREALAGRREALIQDDELCATPDVVPAARAPHSASNLVQALRPISATCIANPIGTAPGLWAKKGGCTICVVPGVPREMQEMFTHSILPELKAAAGDRITIPRKLIPSALANPSSVSASRTLCCAAAIPASALACMKESSPSASTLPARVARHWP